jgi:hypothetical protein
MVAHSPDSSWQSLHTQAVLPAEPCPVLLSADRMRSFDVYIGDTEPTGTSLATLASNTLCASVPGQASTDSVGFRVACTSVVPGRYLVVQLKEPDVPLTLCEVEPETAGGPPSV